MVECEGKYDEWIVDDLAGELDEERRAELDAHLAERDEGVVEKGVRIDPSIAERLRAMGYLR